MFRMRASSNDALYVVDRDQKPVGVVMQRDVTRAVRDQVEDLNLIIRTDFPLTECTAALADVYNICTEDIPIAVVNDTGQFLGEVHALDLLANLSPESFNAAGGSNNSVDEESNGAVK